MRLSFTVEGSAQEVWALLLQPVVVAACVPGATLISYHGGDFDGWLSLGRDAVQARYRGEGTVTIGSGNQAVKLVVAGYNCQTGRAAGATVTFMILPAPSRARIEAEISFDGDGRADNERLQQAMTDLGNQFADRLSARLQSAGPESKPAQVRRGRLQGLDPLGSTKPAWLYERTRPGDSKRESVPVFVSYNRADSVAVEELVADLATAGIPAWRDVDISPGDDWWREICDHIVEAPAFVQVISEAADNSEACRKELEWARSLDIPVLRVQFGQASYGRKQVINYKERSPSGAIRLVAALMRCAAQYVPFSGELPQRPSAPGVDLTDVLETLEQGELSSQDQQRIVDTLGGNLSRAHSDWERDSIRSLLRQFIRRPEAIFRFVQVAKALLGEE